jgi:HK97 family phage major capsid protein
MEQKEFDAKLDSVKEAAITEAKAAATLATENLTKTTTELAQSVTVLKDAADKNQEFIDKFIANQKQIKLAGDEGNLISALDQGLKEKAAQIKEYRRTRVPVSFDLKAVGNIGSGNFTTSGTDTWTGAQNVMPGVARIAYPRENMRDILGTTNVQSDSVYVLRGVAGEGAPTTVAPGASKPQSDADWIKVIIPITKIAHHYRIPEENLEDLGWLRDDITQTGIAELIKLENSKIISNNTAGEFTGLVQNSTAFAAPTGLALGIEAANNYDVLVAAQTQLRNGNRDGNFILTDNDGYARMILTKATTGEYVFGAPNIAMPNVFGVPIYPMNSTALADKFIVGDRNYATIAVRAGISVRFYDQDQDNAIKNLVTVVIEERLALVVKRTDAFIYGDFSDARTALETA